MFKELMGGSAVGVRSLEEIRKAERTRNLCILAGACAQSMTLAGLYSAAMPDQAIEDAEYMLDRIERGPEKPEEAQP